MTLWQQANPNFTPEGPRGIPLTCGIVRAADMDNSLFAYWSAQLGDKPSYHRKLWENFTILQAIWQSCNMAPGKRGLGFGVGLESTPAYFASQGCSIVATDIALTEQIQHDWVSTGQHCAGDLQPLNRRRLCPDDEFKQRVSYREVDMNNIPADLIDFDFTWSAGSLDHLGTLEKGADFILNSMRCLKPGGIAVHTTEYNLSSNERTLEEGTTVFYRKKDIEALHQRLLDAGYQVMPLSLTPGTQPLDLTPDRSPYCDEPHLSLEVGDLTATSIVIIALRPQ